MADYLKNRSVLIGAAVVLAVIGGILLSQRMRRGELPGGEITQATPTPVVGTVDNPIPGQPQVSVITSSGQAVVELRPQVDNTAVAEVLGRISREECTGKTAEECGLIGSHAVTISGALSSSNQIISATLLSK